ncbi:MAG: anaerobic ribonucleoside-triphosphate reductase activating protein [Candidatus Kappaea frigidicola]|nr:anaerobic ribonucleoside-triphosphate reductase activating protein [Candidatus Kappaea frigidicola]
MKTVIKGFIKSSLLDWDGKIVSTLYVPHCNMRCPFCHNRSFILTPDDHPSVEINEILDFYKERKNFLDGICLTGGEPCLYDDLVEVLKPFKEAGALIKLDSNGTSPEKIRELVDAKLIDYIAMDIKNALEFEKYKKASSLKSEVLFENVKESINYIKNCKLPYEFRTTVVPTIHEKQDIIDIAKFIKGAEKYALQNFQPENTLDVNFEKLTPFTVNDIEEMADSIKSLIEKVVVRAKG